MVPVAQLPQARNGVITKPLYHLYTCSKCGIETCVESVLNSPYLRPRAIASRYCPCCRAATLHCVEASESVEAFEPPEQKQ